MELRPSRFGLFYGCTRFPACKATHGAHADGRPLGIPADERTKQARMAAHRLFDRLWKRKTMRRKEAYKWMRKTMGMTSDEAHIGRFDQEQCIELITKVHDEYPELVR